MIPFQLPVGARSPLPGASVPTPSLVTGALPTKQPDAAPSVFAALLDTPFPIDQAPDTARNGDDGATDRPSVPTPPMAEGDGEPAALPSGDVALWHIWDFAAPQGAPDQPTQRAPRVAPREPPNPLPVNPDSQAAMPPHAVPSPRAPDGATQTRLHRARPDASATTQPQDGALPQATGASEPRVLVIQDATPTSPQPLPQQPASEWSLLTARDVLGPTGHMTRPADAGSVHDAPAPAPLARRAEIAGPATETTADLPQTRTNPTQPASPYPAATDGTVPFDAKAPRGPVAALREEPIAAPMVDRTGVAQSADLAAPAVPDQRAASAEQPRSDQPITAQPKAVMIQKAALAQNVPVRATDGLPVMTGTASATPRSLPLPAQAPERDASAAAQMHTTTPRPATWHILWQPDSKGASAPGQTAARQQDRAAMLSWPVADTDAPRHLGAATALRAMAAEQVLPAAAVPPPASAAQIAPADAARGALAAALTVGLPQDVAIAAPDQTPPDIAVTAAIAAPVTAGGPTLPGSVTGQTAQVAQPAVPVLMPDQPRAPESVTLSDAALTVTIIPSVSGLDIVLDPHTRIEGLDRSIARLVEDMRLLGFVAHHGDQGGFRQGRSDAPNRLKFQSVGSDSGLSAPAPVVRNPMAPDGRVDWRV